MTTEKDQIKQCYKIIHQISHNLDEANHTPHHTAPSPSVVTEEPTQKSDVQNNNCKDNQ